MATKNTKEHKKSKHRRMLKTGCLSVVVLFLVFVFAAVAWFFYVTREVEVHDEDLVVNFENVPDEVNGYFVLDEVLSLIDESNLDSSALSVINNVPSDENLKAYRLFWEEYPDVLNEFYSVAGYKHCRKPIDENEWGFTQDIMPIADLFTLGNLSLCHVELLMREGRKKEALDCLATHLRIGQTIQNDANALVSGMVGLAVHNQSLKLLVEYLSQGDFSKTQTPALKEMVVTLRTGSDWTRMIKAEYFRSKSVCSYVSENFEKEIDEMRGMGKLVGEDYSFTDLPLFGRSQRFLYNETRTLKPVAQFFRKTLASFKDPDVRVKCPRTIDSDYEVPNSLFLLLSGNSVGTLLHAIMIPSISKVGERVLEQKTRACLVELYLAVWDYYEAEGELPNKLEQLVTDYIPELPVDPFGKGAGFLYDPEKKEIYSAGIKRSEKHDDLRISLGFAEKGACIDI